MCFLGLFLLGLELELPLGVFPIELLLLSRPASGIKRRGARLQD